MKKTKITHSEYAKAKKIVEQFEKQRLIEVTGYDNNWKPCKIPELKTGDIVIGVLLKSYVVTRNYGNRVTAVDSVDITNESEWMVHNKQK